MEPAETFDHGAHARRHRGGALFEQLGIDLYPHPYLGFSLPPHHRSAALNTDGEGFRLSESPFGTVDSRGWLTAGGGGLVLGSSAALGFGSGSDGGTLASRLALRTGLRWHNLAVVAANSLQELIAAVPYLHAASTVVVFSGMGNYLSMMRTRSLDRLFPAVFYEGTFARLTNIPLFDLAELATGMAASDAGIEIPPMPVPPEPRLGDAIARVEAAARAQLRDLGFLAGAARPGTRLLFCLQPLATHRTRAITPEEQEHYDFTENVFGVPNGVLEDHLPLFAELLAQGCAELGVDFLNVSADRFTGRSFVTNGVLTEEGNAQAARMIHEALGPGLFRTAVSRPCR
ncbi:hypothetical protein [Actinomadura sp. 9N407]|uniref:hypothetical protein n=1 Tax=Actinomadura sp. 9N407 TaxID=3375154 RepID=UPI0037AB7DBE